MKCSLIITTYNRPEALELVLLSVERQTVLPEEVIIADDGSDNRTQAIINNFQSNKILNIQHSWQEDKGFRAAKSRNKAISISTQEYIVLIDGDMVLHTHFIEDHLKHVQKGFLIQGKRSLLTKTRTSSAIKNQTTLFSFFDNGLQNHKNSLYSNLLSRLFASKKTHLKGIKTCNMSFFRSDCIAVNGFNENFEGWGREDSEFVVRLFNYGVLRKTLRFQAIQYHLYHHENSRGRLHDNDAILQYSIANQLNWCDDGIDKHLKG
jgi:glycosyltransferase involved in cell wall biosynthesis